MRLARSVIGCLAVGLACASGAQAATLEATPSSLASVFSSSQGGDTIMLAPGDYGRFAGGSKSSTVTLKPQAGASPAMDVEFAGASNVRLEGLTIGDLEISGSTRDVSVAGSRFTGFAVIRTSEMSNANVVLDGNTHADINTCGGCYEGRITLPGKGSSPSGVTIRNSLFRGGNADGIQNGSRGTSIIGNEFVDIYESAGNHTDAIQLYGSSNTLVRGNWIHRTSTGIMAPDGADHEVIEHNVIAPGGYPFAITLSSDDGSIVRHNTLPDGACSFNLRCGLIAMGPKSGLPAGRGTVIKDNIFGKISIDSGSATTAENDYNLIADDAPHGAHDRRGRPTYVGGSAPGTFAGFKLADRSLGSDNASDGTDRGAAIGIVTSLRASRPSGGARPTGRRGAGTKLSVRRRVSWRRLRRGLRVRVTSPVRARVTFVLRRKSAKRAILRRTRTMRAGTRSFLLRPRRARLGRRRAMRVVLTVRLTDGSGGATRLRRTIRVRR